MRYTSVTSLESSDFGPCLWITTETGVQIAVPLSDLNPTRRATVEARVRADAEDLASERADRGRR